jgi:hypothetical protein
MIVGHRPYIKLGRPRKEGDKLCVLWSNTVQYRGQSVFHDRLKMRLKHHVLTNQTGKI